jgi:hypothetical protein
MLWIIGWQRQMWAIFQSKKLIQAINCDFGPFFLIDNLNPNEYNPP